MGRDRSVPMFAVWQDDDSGLQQLTPGQGRRRRRDWLRPFTSLLHPHQQRQQPPHEHVSIKDEQTFTSHICCLFSKFPANKMRFCLLFFFFWSGVLSLLKFHTLGETAISSWDTDRCEQVAELSRCTAPPSVDRAAEPRFRFRPSTCPLGLLHLSYSFLFSSSLSWWLPKHKTW